MNTKFFLIATGSYMPAYRRRLIVLSIVLALHAVPVIMNQVSAQIPQGFNYQAIARDVSGNPITNYPLPVRITIQSDSLGGTVFWTELHSSVATNQFGLFSLVIGKGARQSGTASSFSDIDWSVTPKFLKTEIDYSGWKYMGTSRIYSVPYALVAGDIKGPLRKLSVDGETGNPDEALFEVKNRNGQTVFAVYSEGVRIYVDDGIAKGVKGGFAIGGFGSGKAGPQDYFIVSPDSIRAYIYDDPLAKPVKGGFAIGGYDNAKGITGDYLLVSPDSIRAYIAPDTGKGVKGGFAIGGLNPAKASGEEYLRVSRDSTRIYVNEPAKGVKGGFAIGGFNVAKGTVTPYTALTPDNYLIGEGSGFRMTTGKYNSFLGFNSGLNNTSGGNNAFFGYQSGYSNTDGNSNLFVGYQSGFNNQNGSFNSFMGYQSGYSNSSGQNNTFIGSYAGKGNSSGSNNTFLGFNAGYSNVSGTNNSFIGTDAGYTNSIGKSNIFIGPTSGYFNTVGDSNVFIGVKSGMRNISGKNNLFFGSHSGFQFTSGVNNILIGVESGPQTLSASNNIFIGYKSGYYGITTGSPNSIPGNGNIWIGKYAGLNLPRLWMDQFDGTIFTQRPLENTLVIDQNEGYSFFSPNYPQHYPAGDQNKYPLIFGNFSFEAGRRCVVINGVYSYTYTFFVNGQAGGKSSWASTSDEKMKKNIVEIGDALNKILALRGVNFEWKDSVNFEKGLQMGFIAQEAQKVIPEVVRSSGDDYSMYYAPVTALLVEGIKEQQKVIESQNTRIDTQEKELELLKSELENIKALLAQEGIK